MLEFGGFHVVLCRLSLAQMSELAQGKQSNTRLSTAGAYRRATHCIESTRTRKQSHSLFIRVSAVRASTTKGCSWGSARRQTSTTNWYESVAF
jgi:hypothetical protein